MAGFRKHRKRERLIATLQQGHTYEFVEAVEALAEQPDDEVVGALLEALRRHVELGETYTPGILALALAKIGNSVAIQPLIDAMATREPWQRDEIEKGLARFGAPAIAPLIRALAHDDSHIREGAVTALTGLGKIAVAPLLESLAEESTIRKRGVAQALGQIGDRRAADPLIATVLESSDHELVASAASALGKIGDKSALGALLGSAVHSSAPVRAAVAQALGTFPDPGAVQSLIRLLYDENEKVWKAAQESLVRIGIPAIDPLTVYLEAPDRHARNRAAVTLVRIDGVALHRVLSALEDNDPQVRASAAESLGAFKLAYPINYTEPSKPGVPSHESIVGRLVSALEDPDYRVRRASARSLGCFYDTVKFLIQRGEINADRIVDGLLILVERQSEPAREAAADSLLSVALEPGPIIRVLKHPHPMVRDVMVNAITRHFARLNIKHGYFPSWFRVEKDFYHVMVGESARLMIGVLTSVTLDPEPRVRADAIKSLRFIRAKLFEKRVIGNLDIHYSWAGELPRSQLDNELEDERGLDAAVRNAVAQLDSEGLDARRSEPADTSEADRYTDLTIYEGHLYRGDDLVRETRLAEDLPLLAEERYTLEVAVRLKRTGIDAAIMAPRVRNPRQDTRTLTLFVFAQSKCSSVEIGDSFVRVSWPYDTDSESALFRLKVKGVEPGTRVSQGVIQVRLYDAGLDLLDIVELTVTVASEPIGLTGLDVPPRILAWPDRTPGRTKFDPSSPPRSLSIDVSFDAARQKYFLLFKFLRKDEKSPLAIPGTTEMTANDVDKLLVSIRDFWTELVITNYEGSLTVTNATFTQYLKRLRQLGMRVWTLLFGAGYAAQEGSSEALGKLLSELALTEGSHIQITGRAADLVFPWSLLHPPEDETVAVNPLNFWGARYVIEQVTDGPKYDMLDDEPIGVLFALDRNFGNSETHERSLQGYAAAAGERLVVTPAISDEGRLFQELTRRPSPHLVYCFCHGYAPAGGIFFRRDGVKLLKERIEALEEESPARRALETLLRLTGTMDNESWMYIGGAEITESQLNLQRFFEIRRPIVFLNMCQSAELLPSMSNGLVRLFLKHNASAVVGTECPMTAVFADAFARQMFDSLFRGDEIGIALWKARRHFLQKRNPLGLAYTLYGRAVARLGTGSILPDSIPSEAR